MTRLGTNHLALSTMTTRTDNINLTYPRGVRREPYPTKGTTLSTGSRLNLLPDEIYQNVLQYVFLPTVNLRWYHPTTFSWNQDIPILKCCRCHRSSKEVSLSHQCAACGTGGTGNRCVCEMQLVCWDCYH